MANISRRSFLSKCGQLSFTSIAARTLPFSVFLTGCDAEVYEVNFLNWSRQIDIPNVVAAKPLDAESLITVVNAAVSENMKVRPFGQMHNWSPLAITNAASSADTFVLIDMSAFNEITMIEQQPDYGIVTVGAGVLAEDLYAFLDTQKSESASPTGYAFSNTPAPGGITVGGMMTIGGHGTGVEYTDSTESKSFNGCISNTILSLTAVVWNDDLATYELREFTREEQETAAFLVHVGRAFIIEYTLQAVPNYYLRCTSYTYIGWQELFAPNADDSEFTVTNLLNKYGRLETIWFPNTETPWLKIWQQAEEQPSGSLATEGPYNYPFSDSIPAIATDLISGVFDLLPEFIKSFGPLQLSIVKLGLAGNLSAESLSDELAETDLSEEPYDLEQTPNQSVSAADIWGPAYHTLLYVQETTLRVTANGYAVIVPRSQVQEVLNNFSNKYLELVGEYEANDLYPVLGPVEFRFTGLDGVQDLRADSAQPPALSAVSPENGEAPELTGITEDGLVAVWLDLLTIPGASGSADFYHELETWLFENYPAIRNRVEWSKGWAYTADGAWQNQDLIQQTIPDSFANGNMTMAQAKVILNKYDPAKNFATELAESIF